MVVDRKGFTFAPCVDDIRAVVEGERDWCANAANASSVVFNAALERGFTGLNWVGFYRRMFCAET